MDYGMSDRTNGITSQRSRRGRSGCGSSRREGGWSLVEMTISLVLLISIAVFGLQTMVAGWNLQNWSIMQSMTDAYAGIETAYAQRWTFANIPTSNRWPVYPLSNSTVVTIGKTPKGPVNATVVRTSHVGTIDPMTGNPQSYMLESYIVYKDHLRQYCKVSKVYRDE
jgi:type II secretory pathway pseudopilin PulG